ncbi:MAG: hypothetical protein WC584_02725 [Candidatus Pacearchaeota archaeon]
MENKIKSDEKDKSGRLKYLQEEKEKQGKRKNNYLQQLEEIRKLLEANEIEIEYNDSWIKFHENSIENHKKKIQETLDFDEKKNRKKN